MAIQGDLGDLGAPDLLYLVKMRGLTGELFVVRGQDDATLHFDNGRLVHVSSSKVSQRLGELLVHVGKLTVVQLEAALEDLRRDHDAGPLGAYLIGRRLVARADLAEVLTCQAEEIMHRVLAWADGDFVFTPARAAIRTVPLPDLNVERLILDAIRMADEYEAARTEFPGLDTGVELARAPHDPTSEPLTLKQSIVVAAIQRGADTLLKVAEATRLADSELVLLINEMLAKGLVRLLTRETGHRGVAEPGQGKLVALQADAGKLSARGVAAARPRRRTRRGRSTNTA